MSLPYSFDFPGQQKNWLRVQGVSPKLYCFGQQVLVLAAGLSSESSSSWWDGFHRCSSINPPRYASLSRTWDVDAASNELASTLILLSGFTKAIGITRLLDAIGLDAAEELVAKNNKETYSSLLVVTTLSSSFWFWILFKFLVQQVELKWLIFNKWRRLFHSSRVNLSLCQNVCELVFGVNIEQRIQSNSVGPWNMPRCGTSTFDNHLNYCLIVLKDIQHSTGIFILCIGWIVINVCWNGVGVLGWDGVMHVWLDDCWRVSP